MAKRRFQLPGIQDLSKEQELVRALPFEGQHLIIGGPGTGKSVMALLRAKALADEKLDYRFLVFNHLLRQASKRIFGSECSGLLIPDTNQGGKIATLSEVSDDQEATHFFSRVQAGGSQPSA